METTAQKTTMTSAFAHEVIKKGKVLNTIEFDVDNLVDTKGNIIKTISMHTVRYKFRTYLIATTVPDKNGASFVIHNLCQSTK